MAKVTQSLYTPEQEERARAIYNALNQSNDTFEQKIKVLKLKIVAGKEKVDKEGKVQVDEFGDTLKSDDSYALTYVSLNSGGEHTTRITQEQYFSLTENEIYIASGKIDYRLYKDNFNSTPVIVFDRFIPAIDLFVTAMLKLENLKS